jgi:hypothetical protein
MLSFVQREKQTSNVMSTDIAMARIRKVHVDSQVSRGTRTIIPAAEISADVLKDFHKLLFAGDRGETKLRLVKPAS